MQLTAGDKLTAEEMVKNTWIAAVKNIASVSWKSQLRTLLIKTLINFSREYYHKQKYYMLIHDDFSERLANRTSDFKGLGERMDIESTFSFLPIGYRHVFVLHDIIGYKHPQISGLLKLTEGTSRSQLFKVRKILRQILHLSLLSEVNQYAEWNESEKKTFKTVYNNVVPSQELRQEVVKELKDMELINTEDPAFSWMRFPAHAVRST
jgi:RNA polymerase sigma-70 factor (ECF subfamily)